MVLKVKAQEKLVKFSKNDLGTHVCEEVQNGN